MGTVITYPNVELSFQSLGFRSLDRRLQAKRDGRRFMAAAVRSLWSASRDRDAENGPGVGSAFHQNLATVILHDLLHDRKSKSGAVLFAEAHKGMKQLSRIGSAMPGPLSDTSIVTAEPVPPIVT